MAGAISHPARTAKLGETPARRRRAWTSTAEDRSRFDDDTDHFVRYLQRGSEAGFHGTLNDVFAERRTYSAYLRDSFQEFAAGSRATVVHDEAVTLHAGEDGLTLASRSFRSVPSDIVVLALGNWP
ncbi:FAD/NAD(P)-binding protein [Tahibacter aquaticus]|uniref:FAD/NAD(P)-binding protein n=1 Tax=Tahibacter aquaticus TaxID=520092 RepID=UPI0014150F71|nr:FAD/NAD(P)-binding protein [Tahibacter aquaticus]